MHTQHIKYYNDITRLGLVNKLNALAVLVSILFAMSCNSASNTAPKQTILSGVEAESAVLINKDSMERVVTSIVEIAATDFCKNQHPLPVAFRNVQLKYSIKPNKEILYLLCGEFSTQTETTENGWTHFTTIKNSDYEQWIGPNGLTYCENGTDISWDASDLSERLTNRLTFTSTYPTPSGR